MTTYIVTKVRKEWSDDRTHQHIEGVCTSAGVHYTRLEVVKSIEAGNRWQTRAGVHSATIEPISYCPRAACLAKPYIRTRSNSTAVDNLENLPEC